MKQTLKEIQIKHPELGEIIIYSELAEGMNDQIGTITSDYSKYPCYYYANILKNADGTFTIKDLNVIKPEAINVGFMKTSSGGKGFITVITNRHIKGELVMYPSGVIYVKHDVD